MSHNWFIWQCLECIPTTGEVTQSEVCIFSVAANCEKALQRAKPYKCNLRLYIKPQKIG